MTKFKTKLLCLSGIMMISLVQAQPSGKYFGQEPPGKTPELFAPHFISTAGDELNAAFSPDGRSFFFSLRRGYQFTIFTTRMDENGLWSPVELAPFSGAFSEADPVFNADGSRIYYCSTLPDSMQTLTRDFNTCFVELTADGWSNPQSMPYSSNEDELFISFTEDEQLFFFHKRDEDILNIYYAAKNGDVFSNAVRMGEEVNSAYRDFDPFIAPDGNFLLFSSTRPGNMGRGDLYICFRKGDGSWTEAINMGPEINSTGMDYCPSLSPDGKYLFFSSYRPIMIRDKADRYDSDEILNMYRGPGNGLGDIYWVDAGIIDDLRKEVLR